MGEVCQVHYQRMDVRSAYFERQVGSIYNVLVGRVIELLGST